MIIQRSRDGAYNKKPTPPQSGTRRILLIGVLMSAVSCMVAPVNGSSSSSNNVLTSALSYWGYHVAPSKNVVVQALGNPATDDPKDDTKWVTFGTTTTSATPSYLSGPDPAYSWFLTADLPQSSWPQGGLARIRVRLDDSGGTFPDGFRAVIFDDDFGDCQRSAPPNLTWQQVGNLCASPYRVKTKDNKDSATALYVANLVSTDASKLKREEAYLTHGVGRSTISDTESYYERIEKSFGPLPTLDSFKVRFGFGDVGSDEVSAIYYNAGDLGLGREMHCKSFSVVGVACYVSNFGKADDGNAQFAGEPSRAIAQAIAFASGDVTMLNSPIATVAMTYDPSAQENAITFIVFKANGDRDNKAVLDKAAQANPETSNITVPNNCLACHGGSGRFNTADSVVTGAHFLPFDVFSYDYSSQAGYTFADQTDKFRRLNEFVSHTNVTPALKEMLDNAYVPGGPGNPLSNANKGYVPKLWQTSDASAKLYLNVVAPFCRTCHLTQKRATDWNSYSQFVDQLKTMAPIVCGPNGGRRNYGHAMPASQVTQGNFWSGNGRQYKGSARAHLVNGLDLVTACGPDL